MKAKQWLPKRDRERVRGGGRIIGSEANKFNFLNPPRPKNKQKKYLKRTKAYAKQKGKEIKQQRRIRALARSHTPTRRWLRA